MATKQLRLEKTKQLQIDAAKIAAKIEIGKVANTQITKRIIYL
jgi:nucleoid-associated protein YejK